MRIHEVSDITPGYGSKHALNDNDDIIFKLIKRDCSIILTDIKNTGEFLLRGVEGNPPSKFVAASRLQRNTLHSTAYHSMIIDHALIAAGMTAVRSNSIFCTSLLHTAQVYGTPYYIFPKNGFEFTWTNFSDIISSIERIIEPNFDRLFGDHSLRTKLKTFIRKCADEQGFDKVPFEVYEWSTLTSYWDDKKYMRPVMHWLRQNINDVPDDLKPSELSVDKIIQAINPRNDSIEKPMKSNYEIMVHGEYYALDYALYKDVIKTALF